MKRSRIKPVSDKRKAIRKLAAPMEREFLTQFPRCWICNKAPTAIDHIVDAGSRASGLLERCGWLSVCWECNSGICETMPYAQKLALKWLFDREHLSIAKVCELKGWQPGFISETDVLQYINMDGTIKWDRNST